MKKKLYLCKNFVSMIKQYATYRDAANLLFCSPMTARRRLATMREELGLKKYTRITVSQLHDYISQHKV